MRLSLVLALLLAVTANAADSPTPRAHYKPRQMHGFTVLVHPDVSAHQKEADAAFAELDKQLAAMLKVLPEKQLAELTKVRIWVEWENQNGLVAQFHPSAGWLRDNGYNPEKAGDVEISNIRKFVAWSRDTQPWMVMHEFAHAYHHHVLKFDHSATKSAFEQARDRKLYDKVKHVNGKEERGYAMTNPMEYFAELTEAYLGKNDFFPFERAELEKHDPAGFKLMKSVWGEMPTR